MGPVRNMCAFCTSVECKDSCRLPSSLGTEERISSRQGISSSRSCRKQEQRRFPFFSSAASSQRNSMGKPFSQNAAPSAAAASKVPSRSAAFPQKRMKSFIGGRIGLTCSRTIVSPVRAESFQWMSRRRSPFLQERRSKVSEGSLPRRLGFVSSVPSVGERAVPAGSYMGM